MQTTETHLFTTRTEFQAHVVTLLGRTYRQLATYDQDYADWPIESRLGQEHLARLLAPPDARWRLLVRDPSWLSRHGARFALLRRTHGDRIECRCVPPAIDAGEGLALGDRIHLVRRASLQAWRGRALFAADPTALDPWRLRLEALWDESTPCLSATSLGL